MSGERRNSSSSGSSSITSSSSERRLLPATESLVNMLKREESVSAEGGGFHSKYEPREVLGRYVASCNL